MVFEFLTLELIRNINDPEHPLTLEQLNVVQQDHVWIGDSCNSNQVLPLSSVSSLGYRLVKVEFTPTIPHCSMATLIGLSIRVKLQRCLPSDYKIDVCIREGTHQSEEAINKQLNDKERVSAAVENSHLLSVVNQCLKAH